MPPAIILHSPQLGENIGAAARVMRNFGMTDLRLVSPRDGWPNPAADTMSAGAFEAGVTVSVHETLQDALRGLTFLVAATARLRGIEKRVGDAADGAQLVVSRQGQAGIMFGAEKSGLPNDAVAIADMLMTYPVDRSFQSLNLAMAVGAFASQYGAVSMPLTASERPLSPLASDEARATRDDVFRMFEHFEAELDRAGYFYPPEKTALMKDNLRSALIRADWTEQEVQTFRGAIKALALGRGKARVTRDH